MLGSDYLSFVVVAYVGFYPTRIVPARHNRCLFHELDSDFVHLKIFHALAT